MENYLKVNRGIWSKNPVLIAGDIMLSNINERALSKVFSTKVRSFPGATVADRKPLLNKQPEKIISFDLLRKRGNKLFKL